MVTIFSIRNIQEILMKVSGGSGENENDMKKMKGWPSQSYFCRCQKQWDRLIAAAAAAATDKSHQSCPTLCNPIDGSPPGSPVPEILQARTLEWVAISFSNAGK